MIWEPTWNLVRLAQKQKQRERGATREKKRRENRTCVQRTQGHCCDDAPRSPVDNAVRIVSFKGELVVDVDVIVVVCLLLLDGTILDLIRAHEAILLFQICVVHWLDKSEEIVLSLSSHLCSK